MKAMSVEVKEQDITIISEALPRGAVYFALRAKECYQHVYCNDHEIHVEMPACVPVTREIVEEILQIISPYIESFYPYSGDAKKLLDSVFPPELPASHEDEEAKDAVYVAKPLKENEKTG